MLVCCGSLRLCWWGVSIVYACVECVWLGFPTWKPQSPVSALRGPYSLSRQALDLAGSAQGRLCVTTPRSQDVWGKAVL